MGSIDTYGNIHRPAGTKRGGEFAGRIPKRPETSLTVSKTPFSDRVKRIEEDGFAPVSGGYTNLDVKSTRGIWRWWDEHFRRSEISKTGAKSYLQMPDDYNKSESSGNALSGKRRTHRMLYQGTGIALRMPSVTAIKRFSKEKKYQTFDIPIQAEGNGGRSVSGYVRVTQVSPGQWSVSAPGFPPNIANKVSESVNVILESRRPSVALKTAGDIENSRRLRLAKSGVKLEEPRNPSTFISSVGYAPEIGVIYVRISNKTYAYRASEEVFSAVKNAYSPGVMYNQLIKGTPRVAATRCATCTRWYSTTEHACMQHRLPNARPKAFNNRVRAYVESRATQEMFNA